jgi:zinc metalloprotease ZmpB
MTTYYDDAVRGHVTADDDGTVRHIRHSQELPTSEHNIPVDAASGYLRDMADVLGLVGARMDNLHVPAQDEAPEETGVDYRLEDEKTLFDATTVSFTQTFFDVPVFRHGISVKVKQGPNRVVGVTNNTDSGLEGSLPSPERIAIYRDLFRDGAGFVTGTGDSTGEAPDLPAEATQAARVVRRILGLPDEESPVRDDDAPATGLMNGRLVAYRYDPQRRFAGRPEPVTGQPPAPADEEVPGVPEGDPPPFPAVPPVHESIQPDRTYLCAEMIFRHDLPQYGELVWLMLVEVETDSILYIECQTCFVNGLVFRVDPLVGSGDLSVDAGDADAILEKHDSSEVLQDLEPPVAGTQSLRGTYVVIRDVEIPAVSAPTRPTGADFDSVPRTNDFGAVNAYYHQTQLFRRIADLGFPIATYFDGTTFPTPIDHRGRIATSNGVEINAHWAPNGSGGTGHQCYALCDTSNTAQPLGRSVDPWVHWHEMGGHGTLGDHVGRGTFGFAHSAGDGLAALQMDPESALRGTADRFRYAPFRPALVRRFDRTWVWGGPEDDGGYGSEQILATCHFRIYRSIGGDHPDIGRRRFASRVGTYLILRAIGQLTPGTNPGDAQLWCEELQEADLENWISEGLSGGAYNKVIRWAFEKQGSYGGQPPAVDVYIDDGRGGEYPFQQVHWANQSMWNRQANDGLPGHQNAVSGATNFFFVTINNRGTSPSGPVTVRGYHCLPGAGLTWPNDFTAMSPATGITVPGIAAGGAGVVVGPFEWVPNENVHGHDCALMIASTDGDPSNVVHFTGTESVQEWRLVPNDNNVGQRNVSILPGGGGPESLVASLSDAVFVAGNNLARPARMHLRATLPGPLADRGWSLDLGAEGPEFRLASGKKRTVQLQLIPGEPFSTEDLRVANDRSIELRLFADDTELGGVRYTLDPDLEG